MAGITVQQFSLGIDHRTNSLPAKYWQKVYVMDVVIPCRSFMGNLIPIINLLLFRTLGLLYRTDFGVFRRQKRRNWDRSPYNSCIALCPIVVPRIIQDNINIFSSFCQCLICSDKPITNNRVKIMIPRITRVGNIMPGASWSVNQQHFLKVLVTQYVAKSLWQQMLGICPVWFSICKREFPKNWEF